MEFLQGIDLGQVGAVGVMAFGAVSVVSFFKPKLEGKHKVVLHFLFFLAFGFLPVNVANEIARHLRDAVAGTLLVVGTYTGGKNIAKTFGGGK